MPVRRERLHVKVDDAALSIIDDLRSDLGTTSLSEVVRRSLLALDALPALERQVIDVVDIGTGGKNSINIEIPVPLKAFLERRRIANDGGYGRTLAIAVRVLAAARLHLKDRADQGAPIRSDETEALFLSL